MLHNTVEIEIHRLHAFLEGWLNGSLERSQFHEQFAERLDPGFVNIQPSGVALTGATLTDQIIAGYGKSPDFRIEVREISVRYADADIVLATYHEYQKGARNSKRAENARISSVVFRRRGHDRLIWLHIQETWLPDNNHAAE